MAGDATPTARQWAALLDYYQRVLRREAGAELLDANAAAHQYRTGLPSSAVTLQGPTWSVETSQVTSLLAAARAEGRSLYLAYPVALVRHSGGWRITGLLTTELTMPPAGGELPSRLIAADTPEINAALLDVLALEREEVADMISATSVEDALTSEALVDLLTVLAEQCGLPIRQPLDPANLGPNVVRAAGLHNAAMVYVGSSQAMVRPVLDDLLALSRRWDEAKRTPAAWFWDAPEGSDDRPVHVLAPWSMNSAQEAALHSILRRPLTIVTGPPGTGKSQLIANVVATCWANDRSVLIASTNNLAVDVPTERLRNLSSALLLRTGNLAHRETAATTVDTLARTMPRPGKPVVRIREEIAASWAAVQSREAELRRREQLDAEMTALLLRREQLAAGLNLEATVLEPFTDFTLGDHLATAQRLDRARLLRGRRQRRFLRRLRIASLDGAFADTLHLLGCEHRRRAILRDPTPRLNDALTALRDERRAMAERSGSLASRLAGPPSTPGRGPCSARCAASPSPRSRTERASASCSRCSAAGRARRWPPVAPCRWCPVSSMCSSSTRPASARSR